MCKGILWYRLGDTVVDQTGSEAKTKIGRGEDFSVEDITERIQGLGKMFLAFKDELEGHECQDRCELTIFATIEIEI